MQAPNINCTYFKDFSRCAHPDRPKFIFFRRMCVEPEKMCHIKEQHLRPPAPAPAGRPGKQINDYRRSEIGFLKG